MSPNRYANKFIGIAIILIICLFFASLPFYFKKKQVIMEKKFDDLCSISQFKSQQFLFWYEERLHEANYFSMMPDAKLIIQRIIQGQTQDSILLERILASIITDKKCSNVSVLDEYGKLLFSTDSVSTYQGDITILNVKKVFQTREKVISGFYYCNKYHQVRFEIISPIFDKNQQVVASMVFRVIPADYLYPLMKHCPVKSKSLETVIFCKEGNVVKYVSDLRYSDNANLNLSFPLSKIEKPSVKAVSGEVGMFKGTDYSGRYVLANTVKVPNTPFYIMVKMDVDEILAEFNRQVAFNYVGVIFLLLLISSSIAWLYHHRQSKIFRELYLRKSELYQTQEEYGAILYSIGDGVITTNELGLVKNMNKVAEKLTGWSEPEARGKKLEEVFHILDEDNMKKIDLDFRKIVQEKKIIEYGSQPILVSKNKEKVPVVCSCAPIKNKDRGLLGAVVVFFNRTEERLRHKLIKTRLDIFEYGINHNMNDTLLKALDDICELTQSKFGFLYFLNNGQTPLVFNKELSEKETCEIQRIFQQLPALVKNLADCFTREKQVIRNSYVTLSKILPDTSSVVERDLVIPVCKNKQVVAILGVGNKPGFYTDIDEEIVNFLADVAWVIAEEKRQELKLKKSEEKYRNLFQNSVIQLVIDPLKGCIVDANEAAAEFYGWTIDELKQIKFADINISSKDLLIRKLKEAGDIKNSCFVFEQKKKDGTIAYIESVSSKINIEGKELLHSIIHDVSEKIITEKELVLAKEKAEESNRLKSAFLATISHELRTPLNSIIGFSEIINETTREQNVADFSKIIQESGENLLTIIDDIFDLALVENNKIKIRPVEFTLRSLLITLKKSAKEILKRTAKINSIELSCGGSMDVLDNKINADKEKIIQVMMNLIRNAIKYTDEGTIELGMCINDNDYLSIYVKDTGIGIPSEKQKIIFDFFRQGEDSLTRKYGGIGVGLTISNKIAGVLGGEISVNSVVGKGSVFTFSFPVNVSVDISS